MMKFFIYNIFTIILALFLQFNALGQVRNQEVDSVFIDRNFNLHYAQKLNMVKRVYPIALEAKRIIDSLNNELLNIDISRHQNKFTRQMQNNLEDEFTYLIKDLYIEEGELMMKLIHRETGMTVDEILRKYRGNFKAGLVKSTLALFGHNSAIQFEPKKADWITDIVIQDIESGKLKIDLSVRDVSKEQYKQGMKDYRKGVRQMKEQNREKKKAAKKKRPL